MLPPFHGERMRSYEPALNEIVDAEIDSWPLDEEFPIHPRMQAITLEVILRVVFGVADGPRLERLRAMLSTGPRPKPPRRAPAARPRHAAASAAAAPAPASRRQLREVDELLYAEIAEHRARPDLAEREDILSLLMQAEFEDGTRDGATPSCATS